MKIGKIIDLPTDKNNVGAHVSVDSCIDVPFDVKRTYWIGDIPAGAARGGYAHKECKEFIIAASGSFTVTLDDGNKQETYLLNRPDQGLFVDINIWRTLQDFTAGAICLVLASDLYDANDYIYEYEDFITYQKENHGI